MTSARIALLAFVVIGASCGAPAEPHRTFVDIEASSVDQLSHAQWALSRFELAGLSVPSLSIVFHDDVEACGMREGVLRIAGDLATIHACQRVPSRSRRNLLHELAHAWDRLSGALTEEERARFLTLRGLESWSADGLPWNRRGEEQAAEIIAWGLMMAPAPIPTSVGEVGSQDRASLTAAFETLTGRRPLFDRVAESPQGEGVAVPTAPLLQGRLE